MGHVADFVIDDFPRDYLVSSIGTPWRSFSDRVMGGISRETIELTEIDGSRCLRLLGDVRLENNGGFIQMALDLANDVGSFDASLYSGLLLDVRGNDESYGVHLRTPACTRPWQSYRAGFLAGRKWRDIEMPFGEFVPHRLSEPLDVGQLRRIGLVAIGRAFHTDLAVRAIGFYR